MAGSTRQPLSVAEHEVTLRKLGEGKSRSAVGTTFGHSNRAIANVTGTAHAAAPCAGLDK